MLVVSRGIGVDDGYDAGGSGDGVCVGDIGDGLLVMTGLLSVALVVVVMVVMSVVVVERVAFALAWVGDCVGAVLFRMHIVIGDERVVGWAGVCGIGGCVGVRGISGDMLWWDG